MGDFKFAFITPSYRNDFRQCSLLCESMDRWVAPPYHHYLVIDRRDCRQFRVLENDHRTLLEVEDVVPWWLQRIPWVPRVWLSLKTPPIRNWILQQIVKLSVARQVADDVLMYVDSDVAFIRPFSPPTLVVAGRLPLFRTMEGARTADHDAWNRISRELLGLPVRPPPYPSYISNVVFWRRDNVFRLYDRIEQVSGRGWVQSLGRRWTLSEYFLYGVFAEDILRDESGHYFLPDHLTCNYWLRRPMAPRDLEEFTNSIQPRHIGIMISARSKTETGFYRHLVESSPGSHRRK